MVVTRLLRVDEQRFSAEVISGHKGTLAIPVPFDPTVVWPGHRPVPMNLEQDPRGGKGWPAEGRVNGHAFRGFVGRRYGRSYLIVGPALEAAGLADGTPVDVVLTPAAP